ncbi:MAG TPA: hypothetical protein VME40_14060 [Caulobacteraceae bacterium]|nr:hypothetical protein [Caulobacteraceae bacterium]
MLRKFMLAAALAAVAAPALADTAVTVKLSGLDPKTAHDVIYHAAQKACRTELASETDLVKFYVLPNCLDETMARAEAKYSEMRALASR